MFDELQLWEDAVPRSPAEQMAVDEVLILGTKTAVLRVYRWLSPAATFGYAQRWADVRARTGALPLVRRWTGGGLVFHGSDLTVCLAIPAALGFEKKQTPTIYEEIHGAIREGFRSGSLRLASSEDCRPGIECFASPAPGDLLAGEEKVCGGALRRSKAGVIYQGSIQGATLPQAAHIAAALARDVRPFENGTRVGREARFLAQEKYDTPAWNEMR